MIYIERTIKIKKGEASIDEPVCLYKGDKNIEIRFLIENNPFKYKNDLTINYGQLIIKRENAPDIFSEPTKLNSGRVVFLITGDMINDLNELGNYTFQIRILNEDLSSRGTLPPVFAGITIKEPLCEEPTEPPPPTIYDIRYNGGTSCSYLFYNYGAESLDLSICDVSNITNMYGMFYNCTNLTSLDVSNFNTSNVTDMGHMFDNCAKLTTLDVSNFDTSNVTNMGYMFNECNNLTALDVSSFNTEKVTSMSRMFRYCKNLTSLDISNFDTGKVTDMMYMFYNCELLTSLDVSNFNTNNTTTMEGMFDYCYKLATIEGLENFNTSNVTTMKNMFNRCENLTSIDLSSFDTNKVESIGFMFYQCYGLQSVNLSNFNLENLKYSAEYIFGSCNKLHTIRLDNCSNITLAKLIKGSYAFPTNAIAGVTRKIYCKEENAAGLTPPKNWVFEFVD